MLTFQKHNICVIFVGACVVFWGARVIFLGGLQFLGDQSFSCVFAFGVLRGMKCNKPSLECVGPSQRILDPVTVSIVS